MDWFRELFRHHRRYDEVSEKIREHLEEKIADLMDRGMTQRRQKILPAANSVMSR